MTIPFICIFIAFLLNLVSKGPVSIAMAKQPGGYDNSTTRDQQNRLGSWGRRALAAHLNGFEAFPSCSDSAASRQNAAVPLDRLTLDC
jgi:uncharacterized MAPEG superfamily protein